MLFEINFLIFFISPGGQLVDSVVNLKKIKDSEFLMSAKIKQPIIFAVMLSLLRAVQSFRTRFRNKTSGIIPLIFLSVIPISYTLNYPHYNFNGSTAASTKLANTWIFIHILLWKIGNCPAQMAGGMRGVTCVE